MLDILGNKKGSYSLIIFHILFWLLLALLGYTFVQGIFPAEHTILRTIINFSVLIGAFYINSELLVDKLLEKRKYFWYFSGLIAVFIFFVSIRRLSDNIISSYENPLAAQTLVRLKLKYFFGGGVAFSLMISTMYKLVRNRLIIERIQQENLQKETVSKLQYLKSQINPHLMFNMLNNIFSLVSINSPKAPEFILSFSELLRYSLYTSESGTAMVSEEISQIRRYIDLMQLKNPEKINVRFDCEGEIDGKKILPMVLLPLVENCFKHSDAEENEQGFIEIKLKLENNLLVFSTTNTIRKRLKEKEKSGQIGIENIQERLRIAGGNYSIDFKEEGERFKLLLKMNTL